jgi:plastin-3
MAATESASQLTQEQKDELIANFFKTVDADGSRSVGIGDLGGALDSVGIRLPAYQVRDLVQHSDVIKREDRITFDEFKQLYSRLKHDLDLGSKFKKAVTKREGVDLYGGMSATSAEGTTHTVLVEEQIAFANWINRNLSNDSDCTKLLPIDPNSKDLYVKCADGILLCKMVNRSQPGTIDERAINRGNKLNIYQIHENLTLALNSAQAIGCNIVNIGPDDLQAGKPHLVLGLLWQIIRIGLLSVINVYDQPGLAALLEEGETLEDLLKLSPEQILLRWINYHMRKSGCGRHVTNLTTDIKDSVVYVHLLNQIAPQDLDVTTGALHEPNLTSRAELMLREADKLGCRCFVAPSDVVNGNYNLNLAFVANLFNNHPALEPRDDVSLEAIREETREEKTYRNWMNSMGVSPYVSRLYSDLSNGLVIFQLYDIIRPGCVDWTKVVTKFNRLKMMMEKIENCNYAVDLGKQCKFSLVGIAGKDIYDGNETLTLALVWQLMKAYTLCILAKLAGKEETTAHPAVEKEIIAWTNSKLSEAGKSTHISSFNDPSISDGLVVIDLVDAVRPGSIDYELVKTGTSDAGEKLENAQYAISTARKIGARVYALPEDIVEVKAKMVMTVFACLMIRDLQRQSQVPLETAGSA